MVEDESSSSSDDNDYDIDDDRIFVGYSFSLSGQFSMKQAKIEKLIIENGGKVYYDPDKHTNFVMVREISPIIESKKCLKANDLDIPIITEDFLHDSIKENKLQDHEKYEVETDSDTDSSSDTETNSKTGSDKEEEQKSNDDDEEDENEDNDLSQLSQLSQASSITFDENTNINKVTTKPKPKTNKFMNLVKDYRKLMKESDEDRYPPNSGHVHMPKYTFSNSLREWLESGDNRICNDVNVLLNESKMLNKLKKAIEFNVEQFEQGLIMEIIEYLFDLRVMVFMEFLYKQGLNLPYNNNNNEYHLMLNLNLLHYLSLHQFFTDLEFESDFKKLWKQFEARKMNMKYLVNQLLFISEDVGASHLREYILEEQISEML